MPKIAYIEKDFRGASLAIIENANEIIAEYQGDGLILTLRQLYYQFVARGLIPNRQSEYKRLGAIISDARLAGLIDWWAIEDRTRNLKGNTHWEDPGQIVRAAARGFRIDRWDNQRYRPEVWIEKEALAGVIEGVCREFDVDYFACKGYVSQSEMWTASERLGGYLGADQVPVVIHLGDHDPSGLDMTRDIKERLELFLDAKFHLERIALNMDQIEEYKPPPNPAKVTDSRFNGYIKKYSSESWELDALEPRVLRDLIRHTVEGYRDEDKFDDLIRKEEKYLTILKRVEENWETL